MKLNVTAFGIALGLVWGGATLSLGIVDIFTTWGDGWGMLMSSMYIGYAPTPLGSIIGGIWGFCDGGIGGVTIAWLYNKFAN